MKNKNLKISFLVLTVASSFLILFPVIPVRAATITGEAKWLSQQRVRVWWWYEWHDRTHIRLRITANRLYDGVLQGYYLTDPQFYYHEWDMNWFDGWIMTIEGFESDGVEYPVGNSRWLEISLSVVMKIHSGSNYERFRFTMTLDYNDDVTYNLESLGGSLSGTWRHLTNEIDPPSTLSFQEVVLGLEQLDWGVDEINAERVWGGTEDSHNVYGGPAGEYVKVLIIDSGIDTDHPDLQNNYIQGYDFVNGDSVPEDSYGHGTHCAGIIGAVDNYEGVIGVAPLVDLYIASVGFAGEGGGVSGEELINNVIDAIQWGIDRNVDAISMSFAFDDGFFDEIYWETGTAYEPKLESKINAAYNSGLALFAAAGNHGVDLVQNRLYPAVYENVITVGAIDQNRDRPSWSNYGHLILDIMAPGVDIYSTCVGDSDPDNDGYETFSGTSMACPMVVGVAALVLSEHPFLKDNPGGLKNVLCSSAVDLGSSGYDSYTGWGMVDAVGAVNYY